MAEQNGPVNVKSYLVTVQNIHYKFDIGIRIGTNNIHFQKPIFKINLERDLTKQV